MFAKKTARKNDQPSLVPDSIRAAIKAISGSDSLLAPGDPSALNPISLELEAAAKKIFENLKPGNYVKGQGIYIGKYTPHDRNGKSLRRTFHAFAAPEDLTSVPGPLGPYTDRFTYRQVIRRMQNLKDWHGYDGITYKNDKELYEALKDNSYKDQWVIPPLDILIGADQDGNKTTDSHIFQLRHENLLKNGLHKSTLGNPSFYWSCTERAGYFGYVLTADLHLGIDCLIDSVSSLNHCRPVRFVEVKP